MPGNVVNLKKLLVCNISIKNNNKNNEQCSGLQDPHLPTSEDQASFTRTVNVTVFRKI